MTTVTRPEVSAVPAVWDPFQLMDRLDDEAIKRELEGIASEELVYVIKDKKSGKEQTGLSKGGIDECCNILAHKGEVIREEALEHHIIGQGEEREALFTVRAARYAVSQDGREVKLDQVLGTKRQPLYYEPVAELSLDTAIGFGKHKGKTFRALLETERGYLEWFAAEARDEAMREFVGAILNGEDAHVLPGRQLNPHWYEHGAMKAARNARGRLISADVKAAVIARAKQAGAGKVKTVERGGETEPPPVAERPAAPAGPEPTSETPWPGEGAVKGKRLKDWTEKELLWLMTPGRGGPHVELWQQLARDEWARRTKKPT